MPGRLVSRAEWGARRPRSGPTRGNLRSVSTGHWNGPTVKVRGATTWDHSVCASLVRGIQNFHLDGRRWADIAYNFIVCPHGYIFEGRGLNVVNAANGTNEGNRSSHAVCFLSGEENPFTDDEKEGYRVCIGHIAANTDAPEGSVGHRDHKSTACPGDVRYNWIHGGMQMGPVPKPTPYGDWPRRRKPTIARGTRGDSVGYLQRVIIDKAGGGITADGIFGPNTERRVREVQRFFGATADGIVGPKTWGIIDFLATQ